MPSRKEKLQKICSESFDILVIGGGVTGAGIALDAVSRGFKVALIDMQDFAAGSSSRSTKLIHGGLRYLKQWQFKVVYQTGRERAIAHKIAPFLVHPEVMILPVCKGGSLSMRTAGLALRIYDRLAGVESNQRTKKLSAKEALAKEPLLPSSKLLGALCYSEYRTDDARLTIELIKKATSMGATCLNYVGAKEFNEVEGQVMSVRATDILTKEQIEISATHTVNATGVWTDKVWNLGEEQREKILLPSKGVHLVFAHERLAVKQAVYFDTPDGRMIFAIPRGGTTYVGTTDDRYEGELEDPPLLQEDVDYLLNAVNEFFELPMLSSEDVIGHWVGIRPLILDGKKQASEISRKDEIFQSSNGLISITGGKLTGYRLMAKKTVDLIARREKRNRKCRTRRLSLGRVPFKSYMEVLQLIESIQKDWPEIDELLATYLVHTYGNDVHVILEGTDRSTTEFRLSLAKAEYEFTKMNEFVTCWDDFAIRRTGWRYFHSEWETSFKEELRS